MATIIVAVIALVALIRFSPFMAQDACLDAGGAWIERRCVH
ncbi:MAG: hypothetical protein QHC90_18940 [Shinella sp.]|nr:hypothetical protein [Shinella sp.]